MIEGETIVCISPTFWGDIWRNRQHIMSRLAARNRVVFVEPYGAGIAGAAPPDGVTLLSPPRSIPFGTRFLPRRALRWTAPIVVALNTSLLCRFLKERLRQLDVTAPILWLYDPLHVDLVDCLNEKLVCWHVHDETSKFPFNRKIEMTIRNCERRLLACADLVFASSRSQYECRRLLEKKVHYVPNAGDFRHFNRVLDPDLPIPDDVRDLSRPILGFYGGVDFRIDIDLLRYLAQSRPQWSIVLIGPNTLPRYHSDQSLLLGTNIRVLGAREYSLLPAYIKAFDVVVLPYDLRWCLSMFPLKTYECLAAGKPIVSTALPEVTIFKEVIWVARSPEEFLVKVEQALEQKDNQQRIERGLEIARENTWDKRVAQMLALIEEALRNPEAIR